MIDPSEELIPLREAARLFPKTHAGRPPHVSCVYRAVLRGHAGVRLAAVRTPRWATSREAVGRYFRELTEKKLNPSRPPIPPRPRSDERRQERIRQELDRIGL